MKTPLNLKDLMTQANVFRALTQGNFGLEIEQHRVTSAGQLSHQAYPTSLGSRQTHAYLQTDYSETQLELVTEPLSSFEEARDFLMQLQWVMRQHMLSEETIWPLSMPPKLSPADLTWVNETFGRPWLQQYRNWLTEKYGATHEMMTGVHLNYSLPTDLLQTLFDLSDYQDFIAFKNDVYFKLAQQITAHQWLFIYLFGATPFSLNETDSRIPRLDEPVRSIRTSKFGFKNDTNIKVDYASNLTEHVAQIERHIKQGDLFSDHEFYGPVRFKGFKNQTELIEKGVSYIEIRILDTDPFDLIGISENTLNLIHLLLIFFLLSDTTYSATDLLQYDSLAQQVALQNPTESLPNKAEALMVMEKISQLADQFGMRFNDGLSLIAERILKPSKTPAARLVTQADSIDKLQEWATALGNERGEMFHVKREALAADLFGTNQFVPMVKLAMEKGIRINSWTRDQLTLATAEQHHTFNEVVDIAAYFPEMFTD